MGVHTLDSEVSLSPDPQSDTLERSSKRRRIGSSPPSASTMDFWGVSSDDPAAMISPVPIDPWLVSELALQGPSPEGFVFAEQSDAVSHVLDVGNGLIQQDAIGSLSSSVAARRPSSQSSSSSRHYERRSSPFVDCRNAFYALPLRKFKLPEGGSLDTYLKFNRGPVSRPSAKPVRRTQMTPDDEAEGPDVMLVDAESDTLSPTSPYPSSPVSASFTMHLQVAANTADIDSQSTFYSDRRVAHTTHTGRRSPSNTSVVSLLPTGFSTFKSPSGSIPRYLSPFSSPTVRMDDQGMRLWNFYQHNFIPGRAILVKTNLWQDFGGLVEIPSVLSAIQSYMGLYIYDFTQNLALARRINREFNASEARLSHLLALTPRDTREDSELVTLAIIMALQDAVLPERRRKLPHQPRWMQCSLLAEEIINRTHSGMEHRKPDTVQLTPLQTAHTVMVGRALILSECMVELRLPTAGDLRTHSNRFPWLLYGNADEIHGGCGFSRRLLYTISTITRMAACHVMSPDSHWPMFAKDVLEVLQSLKQINAEAFQSYLSVGCQPIEDIRNKPVGYVIRSREEMTDVSAEAWRITVIAYMQCRFWRLPRNHPEVVSTVTDLAHCIRILPTFGSVFTAQAPLLPVFFLGMLGTTEVHRAICQGWMSGVLRTSSRSSVPPLHQALTNIWGWISEDPKTTPIDPEAVSGSPYSKDSLNSRYPWWEYLVSKVQSTEQEILYVT